MNDLTFKKTKVLHAVGLFFLGSSLAWLIFTKSFAAFLAEIDPELSLSLNPKEPAALVRWAQQKYSAALRSAPPSEDRQIGDKKEEVVSAIAPQKLDRIETWARSAMKALPSPPKIENNEEKLHEASEPNTLNEEELHEASEPNTLPEQILNPKEKSEAHSAAEAALLVSPLNAHALRLLGQISSLESPKEKTDQLMEAAKRRSLRESTAIFWLLQRSLETTDVVRSSELFNILLRTSPESQSRALAAFVKYAEIKEANEEVKKLLATNPPWRVQFFENLSRLETSPLTSLDLFLALQSTPAPVEEKEIATFLNTLISKKSFELAYYAWLQFLPPEELKGVGFLYNGSFENKPSGSPFDWNLRSGNGVTLEIVPRPEQDKQKALFIEFHQGRVEFNPVQQHLILSSGSFQLTGKYKGKLLGKRGLVWRVSCLPNGSRLAETPMVLGNTKKWTEFSLDFDVPDKDCSAQIIRLELDARSSSEKLVTGSLWFDELDIIRKPTQENSSPETSESRSSPDATSPATEVPTADIPPSLPSKAASQETMSLGTNAPASSPPLSSNKNVFTPSDPSSVKGETSSSSSETRTSKVSLSPSKLRSEPTPPASEERSPEASLNASQSSSPLKGGSSPEVPSSKTSPSKEDTSVVFNPSSKTKKTSSSPPQASQEGSSVSINPIPAKNPLAPPKTPAALKDPSSSEDTLSSKESVSSPTEPLTKKESVSSSTAGSSSKTSVSQETSAQTSSDSSRGSPATLRPSTPKSLTSKEISGTPKRESPTSTTLPSEKSPSAKTPTLPPAPTKISGPSKTTSVSETLGTSKAPPIPPNPDLPQEQPTDAIQKPAVQVGAPQEKAPPQSQTSSKTRKAAAPPPAPGKTPSSSPPATTSSLPKTSAPLIKAAEDTPFSTTTKPASGSEEANSEPKDDLLD